MSKLNQQLGPLKQKELFMCVIMSCLYVCVCAIFSVSSTHIHTPPPVFHLRMTFRYGQRLMWLIKAGIGVWQERLPMFPSLSRCQPSGHTVRSREVTTGNFLFDQLIGTYRSLLQLSSKQESRIWTWQDTYAEKGSPMGSTLYVEHKCAKDMKVCQSCVYVVVFSLHLCWSALSPERR